MMHQPGLPDSHLHGGSWCSATKHSSLVIMHHTHIWEVPSINVGHISAYPDQGAVLQPIVSPGE